MSLSHLQRHKISVLASKDGEEKKRVNVNVTSTSDREAKGIARARLHQKGYTTHSATHMGYDHHFWDTKNESTNVNESETFCSTCNQEPCVCGGNHIGDVNEKTLTAAELKKREEIAKALERKNPRMDMGRKMAIATAVAKRVAEQVAQKFPPEEETFIPRKEKLAGDKMLPAMATSFGAHSKILRTRKVVESIVATDSKE